MWARRSRSLRALSLLIWHSCSKTYCSSRTWEKLCFRAKVRHSSQWASRPPSRRYFNALAVSSSIVFLQHLVVERKIRCVREAPFQVRFAMAKVLIDIHTGQLGGVGSHVQQRNALEGFDAGNLIA